MGRAGDLLPEMSWNHCVRPSIYSGAMLESRALPWTAWQQPLGPADYIAIREALVNLFIHQDYSDRSAAAQIELTPDRAVFFNAGRSLVTAEGLIQGGKSQSRNPLVARALRLVGFADLAGSGLRELQRVWRSAKRRPPKIVSDKTANTFTLTLDWREVPNTYDKFWKDRLGVQLTGQEAAYPQPCW